MITDPIEETLGYDSQIPTGKQPAWHAVIHVVVPCRDRAGNIVDSEASACDYIAETLRDQFLDWAYVHTSENLELTPLEIFVSKPYVEGSFLPPDATVRLT